MAYLLYDPNFARFFYCAILSVVGFLAWRSGHDPLQRLWLLLFGGWVVFNVLYAVMGPGRTALAVAGCDAVICIACGRLAIKYKLNSAWSIVSLYVISCGFILGAWLLGMQGGFGFYLTLNMLFLARMTVVGVDAVARMVPRRNGERSGALHLLGG